ncbi:ADP-ribosyl-[dinitrogen reductase] hydrolase [Paludibacterium yongneupense]|uniref:ADP-ribosyl-[dinitrogen reductase] hydrolase n=1 Tax=Paludibacterium yongneupense TaxID=400061 RepID=UPI0004171AAF|nr:ADP-ribosyl-[dinitrogen reductase] hydrolase [Paludibacterium yongneupense]
MIMLPAGGAGGIGLRERVLGAYIGFAVGDALGAPVEFLTEQEIRMLHGTLCDMVGGGWLRLRPGQVTDDTQMCLALGDAIEQAGGWNLSVAAEHFLGWYRSKPVDIGNTCRRGIARYLRDGSLESPFSEGDAGNGAVMRNLPLAVLTLGDDEAFARFTLEQCHFTHNHPLSDAAALALGHMTRTLLGGHSMSRARAIADGLVSEQRLFNFEPYPKMCTGYVVDTVQTVFHVFFNSDSFEDCLLQVVNRGGDADTNGALAGMLAGARDGVGAIPRRWLMKLERPVRDAIERQVDVLLELAGKSE